MSWGGKREACMNVGSWTISACEAEENSKIANRELTAWAARSEVVLERGRQIRPIDPDGVEV